MTRMDGKKLLPFLGIPVILVVFLALRWDSLDPAILLLRSVLLVLAFVAAYGDLKHQIVSNKLVLIILAAWVLIMVPQLFFHPEKAIRLLIQGGAGFLLAGILFLLVYLLSRKGLGGGDVKLMAVSGLYLGVNGVLPTVFFGALLAAAAGGILILMKKIGPKDAIPLVPFLYVGMVLTVLFR